jgi:hypothetical protein
MALKAEVHFVASPLVLYRQHRTQASGDASKVRSQQQKLYAKWRIGAGLTDAERLLVAEAANFKNGRLAFAIGIRDSVEYARCRCFGRASWHAASSVKHYLAFLLTGRTRPA